MRPILPDAATPFDPDKLGTVAPMPSPGNAWGAIVAPTIDPLKRPDVLNADGSRSSLLSSSAGTDRGEMLYPNVTNDGRIVEPDKGFDTASKSGQHLGIYSSPAMADQAAEAMHNAGAEQMAGNYTPTGWYRADNPGVRYPSQQARDAADMPPAPPPVGARPQMDPGLATFLQRGQRPQFDWSQTAQAPGQTSGDPNRANKIVDAIASGLSGMRPGGNRGRGYDTGYWQGVDQERERKQKEARAAIEADPASQPSDMARRSMAPALKAMGLTDAEIGTMSAADIKALGKGGNIVKSLADARQKASLELAKQRQHDADVAAANAEHDRRFAHEEPIRAATALEAARIQSGMGATNAANQAVLGANLSLRNQQAMAEINDANRARDEARKAAEAKTKAEEGYVTPDEIEASNKHISVTNPNLLHQTQATNKRSVGDIRNDMKTAERAGHLYDQMLADEAAWTRASRTAKEEVRANMALGTPVVSDEAKELLTIRARYEAFGTELQGIKAKIAQSAGSVAEREDAKHEIPAITANGAHERLVGIGGMLESNANANLGATGMQVNITGGASKGEVGAPEAKSGKKPAPKPIPAPAGMVSVRNPQTGTIKHVPAANKDAAVARGWVVVGG